MVKRYPYASGVEIVSAFGRLDYMYVYEVAPPAYDSINDRIKVAIESSIALDIADRWGRQLGQVDVARILGNPPAVNNALPSRLTDGSAYYDARARTWTLDKSDVPDLMDRPGREVGIVYGDLGQIAQRAASLDLYVQLRSGGAEIDPRQIRSLVAGDVPGRSWTLGSSDVPDLSDEPGRQLGIIYGALGQPLQQKAASFELLTYDAFLYALINAGITVTQSAGSRAKLQGYETVTPAWEDLYTDGAHRLLVRPKGSGALDFAQDVAGMAQTVVSKVGLTPQTSRDWSGDLQTLSDDSVKGILRSLGDAGASPTNLTGKTLLKAVSPPWYQPNFTNQRNNYDGASVGPHGWTERWTYTVPANRIAIMTHGSVQVTRQVAAGTLGMVQAVISVGGTDQIAVEMFNNTVGARSQMNEGWCCVAKAGEIIRAVTIDGSTGGTCAYRLNMSAMIFDV